MLCALRHFTGVLAETVAHSLRGDKASGEIHKRGLGAKLQATGTWKTVVKTYKPEKYKEGLRTQGLAEVTIPQPFKRGPSWDARVNWTLLRMVVEFKARALLYSLEMGKVRTLDTKPIIRSHKDHTGNIYKTEIRPYYPEDMEIAFFGSLWHLKCIVILIIAEDASYQI